MKHLLSLVLLAFVFSITGCSQDAVSPEKSTMRVTGAGGGDACFDIPTPASFQVTEGALVGTKHSVNVTWGFSAYSPTTKYTDTVWYAQGKTTPRTGVLPNSSTAATNPYAYEFWGGSQQTIVRSPSYSGHYDIERSTDGVTWAKIGETTGHSFTDDNNGTGLDAGSYSYRVKAKSLEGSSPNQCTHHSQYTNAITIGLGCEGSAPYLCLGSASGTYPDRGQGNTDWETATLITANSSGHVWNQHMKLYSCTSNPCTHVVTATEVTSGDNYDINLYFSFDGGTTWSLIQHNNGIYMFDGNSKLDNPTPGTPGSWPLKISRNADGSQPFPTITVTSSSNGGHGDVNN